MPMSLSQIMQLSCEDLNNKLFQIDSCNSEDQHGKKYIQIKKKEIGADNDLDLHKGSKVLI